MKKSKLVAGVVLSLLGGVAMTGITNAIVTPTVESNGDLTVCGTEYVSDSNGVEGCITIQGKNVGAQIIGAGPSAQPESYGSYFQWGDDTPRTQADWSSSNIQSNNAWGGGSDNNELVYPVENGQERQGPCDAGYHVPSKGEWYALMDMWAGGKVNGFLYGNVSQFYIDFQIPFAGRRKNNNGSLDGGGGSAYLWSSSPDVNNEAWYFRMYANAIVAYAKDSRAYGSPVRCFKNPSKPTVAQINLSILKGTLTIGTEIGNLNLGQVNVSNSVQELSGSFGVNSFWVEDMKGVEHGYYTTISVTDLTGTVSTHVISANNVYLKTAGNEPSYISGATVEDAKVVFGEGITSWHNGSGQVNYFQRLNTTSSEAGRLGKWGDNLQIKVNIPAHTPYDTYRGTITYTLYDNDS